MHPNHTFKLGISAASTKITEVVLCSRELHEETHIIGIVSQTSPYGALKCVSSVDPRNWPNICDDGARMIEHYKPLRGHSCVDQKVSAGHTS